MKFGMAAIFLLVAFGNPVYADTVALYFDSEWPTPSLNDRNGKSVGFNDRLPGTGAAIGSNNDNWNLQPADTLLEFKSQAASFSANLDELDAPALRFDGVSTSADIWIQGSFRGADLGYSPGAAMGIYAGVDAQNLYVMGIRSIDGGFYEYYSQVIVDGVTQEIPLHITQGGSSFRLNGTSCTFIMYRGVGMAPLNWAAGAGAHNFITESLGPAYELPFGDSPNLYFGAFNFGGPEALSLPDARLGFFGVMVNEIPEPSTYALAAIGIVALFAIRRRTT